MSWNHLFQIIASNRVVVISRICAALFFITFLSMFRDWIAVFGIWVGHFSMPLLHLLKSWPVPSTFLLFGLYLNSRLFIRCWKEMICVLLAVIAWHWTVQCTGASFNAASWEQSQTVSDGAILLYVRSSLKILLYKDICLTYSGMSQPLRQLILVLHYLFSQWHTRQYARNIQIRY